MKPFLLAWLVYVVATFVLGFVWHLVLFKDLYRKLGIFTRIDDPVIPLGLTAMIVQGAVLAFLYPKLSPRMVPALDGLKFGLVMGAFIASSAVFAEAAKQRVGSIPTWLAVESIYYLVQFGLVGVGIGLVFGKSTAGTGGD